MNQYENSVEVSNAHCNLSVCAFYYSFSHSHLYFFKLIKMRGHKNTDLKTGFFSKCAHRHTYIHI